MLYVLLIIFWVNVKFLLELVIRVGLWKIFLVFIFSDVCVLLVKLWLMISGIWLLVCILLRIMFDLREKVEIILFVLWCLIIFLYGKILIWLFMFSLLIGSLIGNVLEFFIVLKKIGVILLFKYILLMCLFGMWGILLFMN